MLGANGAGKSTLMNLLTDNVKRDSGEILYDGKEILKMGGSYLEKVGYMPQQQGFYEDFSPKAFLKYMAEIKGVKRIKTTDDNGNEVVKTVNQQIDELLEVVNLTKVAYKKIGGFSGGMKQRVLLAQALLGNPKILILDEPTAGLDPKERIRFRNVISSLANDKIVILATHIVTDIAFIAKNVVLIDGGKMISCASQSELCNEIYGKVWEVLTDYETGMELMRTKRVSNVISEDDRFNVRVVSDEKPHPDAVNVQPALEDVCIYHFGEIGE